MRYVDNNSMTKGNGQMKALEPVSLKRSEISLVPYVEQTIMREPHKEPAFFFICASKPIAKQWILNVHEVREIL